MNTTVKARIRRQDDGTGRVEVQRGKYKHWFDMGAHRLTDAAFAQALKDGSVVWSPKIIDAGKLF